MAKRLPDGYRFYVREFLNKPGEFEQAFVLAAVEKREGHPHNTDLVLKIGDCNRHIALSLPLYDKSDRKNTLYKLDKLITTLIEFEGEVQAVVGECK